MIISGLLNLIKLLLTALLSPIHIPDLPQNVNTLLNQAVGYMVDGLGIFAAFTHFSYIMALLAIVLIIEGAMLLYKFIRWVLKKIPMANIE